MFAGGSRQETLDPGFVPLGTRQQGVPVILRELEDSISCHLASQSDSSVVTSLNHCNMIDNIRSALIRNRHA
ncbi:unnamed protein product [Schistosoma margrebowiei]|uniref:Uncharacterized protein n=1 Tax=Schistosoma margrebowiei TaxID=48269 RepID=A0A183MCC1_9TREM|nr:unnamed protein product [Schistosoma margrebowiei]